MVMKIQVFAEAFPRPALVDLSQKEQTVFSVSNWKVLEESFKGRQRMLRNLVGTCGLLLLCGGTVFAQTSASSPQPSTEAQPTADTPGQPSQGGRVRQHTMRVACWKQAGVAPQMVNDRWKIEDRGKSRIAAVCTDPTLSAAQKHNKIMQINGD